MLVYGEDEALAAWVGERLGMAFSPPYVCIGVSRETLVAAALYNNFQLPNIQITFVTTSPRWATRQVIARILAYPFVELGCARVSAVTEVTNRDARRFLRRLGFRQEGYHPELFQRGDGVSYGLMKHDALKWLEKSHATTTIHAANEPRCGCGR